MAFFCKALSRKKSINPDGLARSQLARVLSTVDLVALGVGSTVGAGLYVLTAEVARETAGPGIVLSFLVAAVSALLSGLCYAEFSARVPLAGTAYIYSYITVGELCAFVIGWNLMLEYIIGASSVARAWSSYLDIVLDGRVQNFTDSVIGSLNVAGIAKYPDFLAFVLMILVSVCLAAGVKLSVRVTSLFTTVNLFVTLVVMAVGFYFADRTNWTRDFLPFGWSGVLSGAATCFFGFVGFDAIATTGEEAINPSKAIPVAILFTLGKYSSLGASFGHKFAVAISAVIDFIASQLRTVSMYCPF